MEGVDTIEGSNYLEEARILCEANEDHRDCSVDQSDEEGSDEESEHTSEDRADRDRLSAGEDRREERASERAERRDAEDKDRERARDEVVVDDCRPAPVIGWSVQLSTSQSI